MDTEYCNKCGLLHDPQDGDCLGCELTSKLKKSQKLNREMLGVIYFYGDEKSWKQDTTDCWGTTNRRKIIEDDVFHYERYSCDIYEQRYFGGKKARQFITEHKLEIEDL